MGCVKQKRKPWSIPIAQIQIILCMHKVSSWPLLYIHTFYSIQWFSKWTVKALSRLSEDMFLHGTAHMTFTYKWFDWLVFVFCFQNRYFFIVPQNLIMFYSLIYDQKCKDAFYILVFLNLNQGHTSGNYKHWDECANWQNKYSNRQAWSKRVDTDKHLIIYSNKVLPENLDLTDLKLQELCCPFACYPPVKWYTRGPSCHSKTH